MIAAMAIEVIVWFYLIIIASITILATVLVWLAGRWVKGAMKDAPAPVADEPKDASMTAAEGEGVDSEPTKVGRLRSLKQRLPIPNLRDPLTRVRWLFGLGIVAILGLAANAAIIPLSSNNWFCGQACHNMNPEYQTWRKSAHAKVTCTACHVDPTMRGLAYEKLVEGPLGLALTITDNHEKPFNWDSHYSQDKVPKARCLRCHANENRKFTVSRGIKMDHKKHDDAGLDCTICHNRVTHLGAEEFEPLKSTWEEAKGHKYKNFLTMKEGCFRCHSSNHLNRDEHTLHKIKNHKEPPGACSTCHTEDFKQMPFGHENKDWRDVHGEAASENFKYCLTCHEAGKKFDFEDEIWCIVCHAEEAVERFRENFAE